MTIAEVEQSLPNGLHDAQVHRIEIDYGHRTITLDLAVWVDDLGDPPERRETYKNAKLQISEFLFLVIEPPDVRYPFGDSATLTIDACDMRENLDSSLVKSLPTGAFFRSFLANGTHPCGCQVCGADLDE